MRNPQFCVSGKRPISPGYALDDVNVSLYTCTLYHPNQSSIVPVQAFNQWRHSFTLKTGLPMVKELNAFRPGDSNMRDWHWSSMVQAMAWRLSAPSHSRTSVNVLPTIIDHTAFEIKVKYYISSKCFWKCRPFRPVLSNVCDYSSMPQLQLKLGHGWVITSRRK